MLAISTCHFPSRDRAVVLGNVFDLFETHAEQAVRHMKHGFHEFVQLQVGFDFCFVQIKFLFANALSPEVPIPGGKIT